jgi:hypothetical protein
MKDRMDVLSSRLELIRAAVFIEKNDAQSYTAGKNVNYYRRALYSEIELLKMELEECLSLSHIRDDKNNKKTNEFISNADSRCNTETSTDQLFSHTDNRNSYNDADNSSSSDRDSLLKSSTPTSPLTESLARARAINMSNHTTNKMIEELTYMSTGLSLRLDIELASYVLHFRRVLFTIKLLHKCIEFLCY